MASAMLAIALLGAAFFVSQSVDRGAHALRRMTLTLADAPAGGDEARAGAPALRDQDVRYAVTVAGAPRRGGEEARVTIVEWSDFQCPFCGRVNATLREVEATYGDRITLVFKHLPLPMHPGAPAAHAAAEAAHRQGKFWAMHDRIFADPRAVDPATLARYAREIGLDVERFRRDSDSEAVRSRIRSDAEEARKLGVTGTPAFFVNGRFLSGAQPYESFKRLIDEELKGSG
jgi:protein-disulfide isomerase